MAHFAKVNKNSGLVERVIVVSNKNCGGGEFPESEPIGQKFIKDTLKLQGIWKQTSYNGNFRAYYAGVGYTYNEIYNVFIPPSPYPSWVLDEKKIIWKAPVPMPNDGKEYVWDESLVEWVEFIPPVEEVTQETTTTSEE